MSLKALLKRQITILGSSKFYFLVFDNKVALHLLFQITSKYSSFKEKCRGAFIYYLILNTRLFLVCVVSRVSLNGFEGFVLFF